MLQSRNKRAVRVYFTDAVLFQCYSCIYHNEFEQWLFFIVNSTFPDYANAVAQTLLVSNCKELLKKYYIKENFLKQADHIYLTNLADKFIYKWTLASQTSKNTSIARYYIFGLYQCTNQLRKRKQKKQWLLLCPSNKNIFILKAQTVLPSEILNFLP